jgi:hypothetical protein
MEKTIRIGNEDIRFKATARTPLLYRTLLKRDLFKDIGKLRSFYEDVGDKEVDISEVDTEMVNIIQMMAYAMAKTADSSVTSDYGEWLDGFDPFSMYPVMNDIVALWTANLSQTAQAKKNIVQMTGK